ncbi:hypothetical protein Tco_1354922 [Tanacetum coccineum]
MDLYHSRLTQDDLNELIIKIPRDLHPRLPSEEFVMSELPDDAIGLYHRIIDFSGVRIPFSSFLLALIMHYKVHFTQLSPLGLNKVFTFEVLCRSFQIESMVTLFRAFQTLCKQGDWFSFAKCHAPSSVCIDDNCSYMKHWKSSFFLIDRRVIPDYMTWRHPNSAIVDPKSVVGSYRMVDVRRLSAHVCFEALMEMVGVMGIHDFLCLLEWTGAEIQEEPHHDIRPTLQRLPFYCTPPAAVVAAVPDPTSEDLAASNPSYVAKRTGSVVAQSSGSTTRPNLFADDSGAESDDDDDDDACYEILIVTPIHSVVVIPPLGNQSGGSAAPAAEGPNTRASFIELYGDAIHRDFFPFSPGPYYATYHEGGIAGNCEFTHEECDAPHQPTLTIEDLSSNQFTAKMSVLHCLLMSHGGELLARYRGLLQSHHEYVQSTDSRLKVARLSADLNLVIVLEAEKDEEILRLKATPLAIASFFQVQFQALVRKFLALDEFSIVQAELLSLAVSAGFERGLSMHRTKEEFSANSEHAAKPLSVILHLEPEKLTHPDNVLALRNARVSPPFAKESTVTPASAFLELPYNIAPASSVAALEPNKEWVNAMVDGPDYDVTGDANKDKPTEILFQRVFHAVDAYGDLFVEGSGCVSSGPSDVVTALSVGEKNNDPPSSSGIEEVVASPSRA